MTPDSPETRLGRLEQQVAVNTDRLAEIRQRVDNLSPLHVQIAEIRGELRELHKDTQDFQREQKEIRREIVERDEATKKRQSDLRDVIEQRTENERLIRKNDSRWRIGTALVVLGLIIPLLIAIFNSVQG